MQVTVTRRSKVGFGWMPASYDKPDEKVDYPDITGTINTVLSKVARDTTFQVQSKGEILRIAWFLLVKGNWKRINKEYIDEFMDTLTRRDWNGDYEHDWVIIEVEP